VKRLKIGIGCRRWFWVDRKGSGRAGLEKHEVGRPSTSWQREKHGSIIAADRPTAVAAAVLLQCALTSPAWALDFDTGNQDLKIRWDNTVKYSLATRVEGRSESLVTDSPASNRNTINLDDGDRNFNKGLISNRLDLLSELDINYRKRFGLRLSGAAWYDTVYNRSNDHDSPGRANQTSMPFNEFTDATRDLHGRDAEILDAFIFANGELGSMPANVRLGKHTLLYGETLFFGANGIANAQSPIDVVKLLSVPNSQFKEIILPVKQISGQIQLKDNLALGGYYQFEFRKSRIPSAGSYFSSVDVFDEGGENFLFIPGVGAPRVADRKARDSGQFGLQLRWRPEALETEFGFYAVRYHDKLFQAYLRPVGLPPPFGAGAPFPLNFQLVYPEDIKSYGASFSTSVGDFNVAGEASVRRNTPLVSGPEVDPSVDGSAGIGGDALYAVGNSAHFNLSAIYLFKPSFLWEGGSFLGEFGWNRRTSATRNAAALDPNSSRDAYGFRFIFEPQYFQVLTGLDLSVPIGVGYNPKGNSSVVQQFNGGTRRGGDVSVGLKGIYHQDWRFSLNYTHFVGSEGPALGADANLTFKQSLADRDFISLSVQTTF